MPESEWTLGCEPGSALTCESDISEGFSVRLLLSAGIRSLYLVLTSSSE